MTVLRPLMAVTLAVVLFANASAAGTNITCTGKFPNPVTDICWSCILPLSIGSAAIGDFGDQEDIENPASPVCSCVVNPTIGISVGFWEPARHVEVVRQPFCLPTLGGVDLNPGIAAPEHGRTSTSDAKGDVDSFYQAHFYLNPVLYYLAVVTDFPCLERGAIDVAYMTELDPLWSDDELALILNPDAVLFANPVAVAACAADCVAASAGFGLAELFWCDGCQGGIFPLNGRVAYQMGGVRSAELLAHRLTAKMHRELIAWGWHGEAGLCGPYFEPVMDKRAYKTQMLYPIAQTGIGGADGSSATEGRCCQPFGRTTILWGAGREFPVKGEDFAFMLFRKRNCCVGY